MRSRGDKGTGNCPPLSPRPGLSVHPLTTFVGNLNSSFADSDCVWNVNTIKWTLASQNFKYLKNIQCKMFTILFLPTKMRCDVDTNRSGQRWGKSGYSNDDCRTRKRYCQLAYTSQVDSVFRAIWLVRLSRNILHYPPSSKTRWRPVLFQLWKKEIVWNKLSRNAKQFQTSNEIWL